MRNLLLLLLVLGLVWFWRSRPQTSDRARPGQPPEPTSMLRCDGCGVHFPSSEAVQGPHGVYCCAEHRQQASS